LLLAAKATDPIERIKNLLTFIIGGLSYNFLLWKNKVPLNSYSGETFQATKDGVDLYIELTNFNPPIYHYYLKEQSGLFELFGYETTVMEMDGINHAIGKIEGRSVIKYKDGSMTSLVFPTLYFHWINVFLLSEVEGLTSGDRIVNLSGSIQIKDFKSKAEGVATFYNNVYFK